VQHRRRAVQSRTAAFARLAGEADAAAHQLDQAAGDGQADAGSFDILVCQALEGAEDAVDLFGRDAGPGVMDQAPPPPARLLQVMRTSPSGRLYLIALETRLMTTCLSRLRSARTVSSGGMSLHPNAAAGSEGRDEGQAFVDQAGEPDVVDVDHQFAGLDGRQVEHLVDQGEQVAATLFDVIDVFPLLHFQIAAVAAQQDLGEAENGVERGAQFVAHAREKFGFGAAGMVGGDQGALEVGDVGPDHHRPTFPRPPFRGA
jgi:hypothetical protein